MTTVIDASVALKWQFEDEEVIGPATVLLHDFVEGRVELITPTLFTYEIVSAINIAITKESIIEQTYCVKISPTPSFPKRGNSSLS